mgnify:CR=1 FL=1
MSRSTGKDARALAYNKRIAEQQAAKQTTQTPELSFPSIVRKPNPSLLDIQDLLIMQINEQRELHNTPKAAHGGKTEYFLVVSRIGGAAGVDRESKTPWVLLERKNNSGCLIDSGKYIVSLRSLHDVTMFDEENMTDGFLRKMSCSGNIKERNRSITA